MHNKVKPAVLLLCGFLIACGQNPLQQKSAHDAARELSDASLNAMKELNPKASNKSDRYRLCMEHREEKRFNCETLYKTMSDVLKKQGLRVSPSQLSNRTFYSRLADDLQELSYYSI